MIARPLRLLVVAGWVLGLLSVVAPLAHAAVTLPPAPAAHFNDYAQFVPTDRARALDARLAQFERDSSNQLVVVIYPKLPAGAALEDFTVRAAQSWGVGQKQKDNGAVLFIFVADRALRIEVGYGLEGVLTDAVSHAIIENELKPRLRAGDPGAAVEAAITAMIAATTGEYRGTGRTHAEQTGAQAGTSSGVFGPLFALFLFGVVFYFMLRQLNRSQIYRNPRPGTWRDNGPWSGGSWGGGSGGSGGSSWGGGGGSFGGGGASGKW